MAVTVNVTLGWCRVGQASRAELLTNSMPGALIELADFTPKEAKDPAKSFARQPIAPFVLSPHTMKRLLQLTLWVKDQRGLDVNAEFPNRTTQAVLVAGIKAGQQRDKIRKERQKSPEGLASVLIDPPLKSSAGWEAWMVSVETALTLACGSKGVPLSCVIRAQEAPDLNGFGQLTWEESAIVGTPLLGLDCHADRMTVHLFILTNIGTCWCVRMNEPCRQRNLSKGTSFQQRVSEVQARSDCTFEGDAPSSGAFSSDKNYFAVLARIGTGSATSSRNIVLEFWSSENFIHRT
jgi:hypothetical protein